MIQYNGMEIREITLSYGIYVELIEFAITLTIYSMLQVLLCCVIVI